MAERSSISQGFLLAPETTEGVAGTSFKRLLSMRFEPQVAANVLGFRSSGGKYQSIKSLGKEWATAALSGIPSYEEIVYPLSSVVTAAAITTPSGGTLSRQWVFTPLASSPDAPVTFTGQHGDATTAEQMLGMRVNEFTMNLNRNEASLGGSAYGQAYDIAATLAGSPGVIPNKPMFPKDFSLYLDTTYGGLGTTKLTRAFVSNLSIANRNAPVWPINSALPSYAATVETEPTTRLNIQVMADAAGKAFITKMRNATTSYIRLKGVTADFIEGAIPWLYQLDFVGQVAEAPGTADADNVYVLNVVLDAFDDGTNPPYKITVVNTRTAL